MRRGGLIPNKKTNKQKIQTNRKKYTALLCLWLVTKEQGDLRITKSHYITKVKKLDKKRTNGVSNRKKK